MGGISPRAASTRVGRARNENPVLALDLPMRPRAVDPLDVLRLPVGERQWLSMFEAMIYAKISFHTLRAWRRAGLLPRTRWPRPRFALFHKADLDRVLAAPGYNGRGHRCTAAHAAIAADQVV
jgi:hypothetical protein